MRKILFGSLLVIFVFSVSAIALENYNLTGTYPTNATATGSLYYPNDMTMDGSGNIYISDTINKRIVKMDPSGTLSAITQPTTAFITPRGIDYYNGTLYVADQGRHSIYRYYINSNTWSILPISSTLLGPYDVAVNLLNGQIYVVDGGTRVGYLLLNVNWLTRSSNYSYVLFPGTPFSNAVSIALDTNGNIYVSEGVNNRLKVYGLTTDPDGALVKGWYYTKCGGLIGNAGYMSVNYGYLYVGNRGKNSVLKLSPSGSPSTLNVLANVTNSALNQPSCAIASGNTVYATSYTNKILIFTKQ